VIFNFTTLLSIINLEFCRKNAILNNPLTLSYKKSLAILFPISFSSFPIQKNNAKYEMWQNWFCEHNNISLSFFGTLWNCRNSWSVIVWCHWEPYAISSSESIFPFDLNRRDKSFRPTSSNFVSRNVQGIFDKVQIYCFSDLPSLP